MRHGAATATLIGIVASCAAAGPASADDRPIADALKATTEAVTPTVGAVVDRAEAAVPVVEPVTSRLRTTVAAVRGQAPVRSALQAVRAPVSGVPAGAAPAARAVVVGRTTATTTSPGSAVTRPVRDAIGPRTDGAIDRQASRRDGRLAGVGDDSGATTPAFGPAPVTLPAATTEPARASTSSTAASGDDGDHDRGFPPFGHDDGSTLLGGPAGIALIAIGMLAALLTLIPRFSSRLLHMSPARWGPVAFLVPIERPG